MNLLAHAAAFVRLAEAPDPRFAYAGVPSGGGFIAQTEYEIGAQRIAEAVHCVLGAVLSDDKYHMADECDLVHHLLSEYSKPDYPKNFREKAEREGEGRDGVDTKGFMQRARSLVQLAKSLRSKVDDTWNHPEIARASYDTLVALGKAVEESLLFDAPGVWGSAYQDPALQDAAGRLEALLAAKEDWPKVPPEKRRRR